MWAPQRGHGFALLSGAMESAHRGAANAVPKLAAAHGEALPHVHRLQARCRGAHGQAESHGVALKNSAIDMILRLERKASAAPTTRIAAVVLWTVAASRATRPARGFLGDYTRHRASG